MKSKNLAPRATLALVLLIALVALTLSGCQIVDLGNAVSTTTGAFTPGNRPVTTTQDIEISQFLTPEIPSDAGTYAYVARVASPSVVSITTEATVYNQYFGSYVESGAGSGVVLYVDAEGGYTYIITNHHVIDGYNTITVYPDGAEEGYEAEVCGTDWLTDVAVIRIEATDLPPAEIGNSQELILGQQVAAIGNPLGLLGGTVTDGIISCLARTIEIDGISMTLIQHSAGVSPGNSGGALFNLYGQLIGIVNAKSLGDGVEAIGYAIPIDLALDRAVQIIEKGYVSNTPYLGIGYSQEISGGLVISGYEFNSELTAGGQDTLLEGDILVALNDKPVTTADAVRSVLSTCRIGDTVKAQFKRRVAKPNGIFYELVDVIVNLRIHEYGSVVDAAQ